MRRIIFTFLLIILFAVGCSSTAERTKIMNTWMGHTRSHLIERWGPPNSVFDYVGDDGKRYEVLTYSKYWSDGVGGLYECKTSFYMHEGKISRWRFEDC